MKYFSTDTAQGLKGVLFTVSQLVLQVCYHLPSHHLLEIYFCHRSYPTLKIQNGC